MINGSKCTKVLCKWWQIMDFYCTNEAQLMLLLYHTLVTVHCDKKYKSRNRNTNVLHRSSLFYQYFSITKNYKQHDYLTILSLTGPILSCILFIYLNDNIALAKTGKQRENQYATFADKTSSTPDKDPFSGLWKYPPTS